MNATEIDTALNNAEDTRFAILSLLRQVETLTVAVLELAGARKLETGADPLSLRSRVLLSDFVELNRLMN